MPKIVDHDERREELARAAVRAIDRLGLEGATMREIAREAGFSTGVLGHYFESKDDIVLMALRFMMRGTLGRLAVISSELRGLKAAHEMAAELLPLDARRAKENRVWAVYWAQALTSPRLRREYQKNDALLRGFLRNVLQEAIDDGELAPSVDAALEANRLLALSDGVSVQALFDRTFWTDARQVDAIDVHLDDLQARGARGARAPVGGAQRDPGRERRTASGRRR